MTEGRPLLEGPAAAAIDAARQRIGLDVPRPPILPVAPPRPALSEQDRRDAAKLLEEGKACRLCAGLHPGGELACPRLAAFELDADGHLRSGSYWRDGDWDSSGVLFASEVQDDSGEGDADDADPA